MGLRTFALVLAIFLWPHESSATLLYPDVVSGRNIRLKNRFELGIFAYDSTLRNIYVEHPYAAHAALGYHVFEWLQFQAVGGFVFLHRETAAISRIRQNNNLQLDQSWQTLWHVGLDAQWAPFYGKLSLFSECDANFQFYVLVGGALEGIERIVAQQAIPQSALRFALGVGVGLRVFLTERFAFRSEIRQSFGFNPPLGGDSQSFGFTTWLHLGISFLI